MCRTKYVRLVVALHWRRDQSMPTHTINNGADTPFVKIPHSHHANNSRHMWGAPKLRICAAAP